MRRRLYCLLTAAAALRLPLCETALDTVISGKYAQLDLWVRTTPADKTAARKWLSTSFKNFLVNGRPSSAALLSSAWVPGSGCARTPRPGPSPDQACLPSLSSQPPFRSWSPDRRCGRGTGRQFWRQPTTCPTTFVKKTSGCFGVPGPLKCWAIRIPQRISCGRWSQVWAFTACWQRRLWAVIGSSPI